ncbi:MAG: hypothetical protein K6E13_10305 [Lachnospiraceae bacterium]|nr:hypothetical protein [Lachnospiraceae bacterium]
MIEKMKMVHVVSTVSGKEKMIAGLRDIGILHLAEKKSADREVTERFQTLSKTAMALTDYAPEKPEKKDILSDEEFQNMYSGVLEAVEKKSNLTQDIGTAKAEIDRIAPWGDFSPEDLKVLKAAGFDFHFYKIGKNEYQAAVADENIKLIHMSEVDKMDAIAVIGTLPPTIPATEFNLPDSSISDLKNKITEDEAEIKECEDVLKKAAVYGDSFNAQMVKAQNEENFSQASATAENDEDFVWISGYIPEADLGEFKTKASENGWAWAVDDVAEDDDQIPTKLRFNKVSGLIKPIFDILGILPGYREQDISIWFLLFFTLFFAMIFGDAGYGALLLIGTIAFVVKTKKFNDATFLLIVLSGATVIWGAITGTWFGMESAMKVPFLKALVIPNFANYPEYFGVSTTTQQNTIMKFAFSIGAIQMALGSILAIKKKIPEKDLSWVADLGWTIAVIAMYLLALYLVIGENINIVPVFAMVGVAFVLVVLFGGMSPDKTFAQGLKSGLADAFTVFLNTISCFGNVMSYIRLFAVGMASLAIAQSFNDIAAGFSGPMLVLGVIVVLIGHGLNIIMAFLSVVVHGVRLNVLEFSGQVGLEWTGIAYDPFKMNDKLKN